MEKMAQKHQFSIEYIEEVYSLAHTLSAYFPNSEDYMTAIYELLINAIEHGNLGIGFDTKTDLIRQGKWQDEIKRRQSMPEFSDKKVFVELMHDDSLCKLVISDQGHGFAWQEFKDGTPYKDRPNGRGLYIVYAAPFESIAFNDQGNAVTCIAQYKS